MKLFSSTAAALGIVLLSPDYAPSAQAFEVEVEIEKEGNNFKEEEVSPNDVSKVYETMDLFAYQTFFDNLSSQFIPPLLGNLTYFTLKDIKGALDLLDSDLSLEYELDNLKVAYASIDPTPPIVAINDKIKGVTMAFSNLNLELQGDYSYVSDPPIFADIGEANVRFSNTSLSSVVRSDWHRGSGNNDNSFTLDFSETHIDAAAEPFVDFDGISDFSEVVTNVVNTVAAVVRNRVESFVNGGDLYGVDSKFSEIVNKVIAMIPSQIYLGDKGIYLDGFLMSNLQAENDVIIAKLMANLRYDNATFDSSQCVPYLHQVVTTQLYDLQIAINDCTINEFIFTLYSAGLTSLPPIKSDKITTRQLKKLVGKGIVTTFGED